MSANSFGEIFKVHTFGESHGLAYGVIVDGCPAGLPFDHVLLESALQKRRPGQSEITTQRQELDEPEVLSGVFDGKTLGTPIAVVVKNKGQRSSDYANMEFRRGHADSVTLEKYGHSDLRGGGRSSGRETLCRVIAGAIAKMLCKELVPELNVYSYTSQIGEMKISRDISEDLLRTVYDYKTRCPDKDMDAKITELLTQSKSEGDSHGGIVSTQILGAPIGLGSPIFKKLRSELSSGLLSIGATLGIEFGGGFEAIQLPGTVFHSETNNHYGGLSGGMSNGDPISIHLGFKPTSSILDIAKRGRHDPCIVPRAVPVVEAMVWLILADSLLFNRLSKI